MLYWPIGAAAYVPTITALCSLTVHILDDALTTSRGQIIAAAALIIAVTSSETGALVGLCLTATMLLIQQGIIDTHDGDWGQRGAGSLRLGIPIKLLILSLTFGIFPRSLRLITDLASYVAGATRRRVSAS